MVRRAGRVLGRDMRAVREEPDQLSARLLVARAGGPVPGEYPRLSVPPAAGRPRLGECWLRALGAGGRMVQQYRLERGTVDGEAIPARDRALRVE